MGHIEPSTELHDLYSKALKTINDQRLHIEALERALPGLVRGAEMVEQRDGGRVWDSEVEQALALGREIMGRSPWQGRWPTRQAPTGSRSEPTQLERARLAAEEMFREVRELRIQLATALDARERDGWIWSDRDNNHLASMTDRMGIHMTAGQLRRLLSIAPDWLDEQAFIEASRLLRDHLRKRLGL